MDAGLLFWLIFLISNVKYKVSINESIPRSLLVLFCVCVIIIFLKFKIYLGLFALDLEKGRLL